MLKLKRKVGESILIQPNIKVTVTRIRGKFVTLAFDAPLEIAIHRDDIYDKDAKEDGPETESRCQHKAGANESSGTVRVS